MIFIDKLKLLLLIKLYVDSKFVDKIYQ